MAKKKRTKKNKIRLSYNAPVTLTFSMVCMGILLIDNLLSNHLIGAFFCAPGAQGSAFAFDPHNGIDYLRLLIHVFGHENWAHLLSNLSFILLLGPLLEDRYGSALLSLMMFTTAFVTGTINAVFIPAALMGASGIAFMMILLASFNTFDKSSIPLTFILILLLYVGREIIASTNADNVANWAHVIGGIIGSIFGFAAIPAKKRRSTKKKSSTTNNRPPKARPPTKLDDATIVGDPTLLKMRRK
ncbi:MAG TPA: rhomboid family intramembrane serine protease [Treponemataceae bacterium]|nr:rhomboid family intramembrane serine protease [Treponemataceae bacterium]